MKKLLFALPILALLFSHQMTIAQNKANLKDLLFVATFDNYDQWYNKAFKSDAIRRLNNIKPFKQRTLFESVIDR